jgi:hypothetical protein
LFCSKTLVNSAAVHSNDCFFASNAKVL